MAEDIYKLKVKVNDNMVELEGDVAKKVQKYNEYKERIELIDAEKKEINKLLRSAAMKMDSLFTDSERRFGENNTIDIMDITNTTPIHSYNFKVKEELVAKAIDKKALISLIADGIEDGWITIKSDEMIAYLLRQQHAPALGRDELDEEISALDFTELITKTKDIPKSKEEIEIKENTEN